MSPHCQGLLSRLALAVLALSWAIQATAQTRGDGDIHIAAMSATQTGGMTQDSDPADWEPILLASPLIDVPAPKPSNRPRFATNSASFDSPSFPLRPIRTRW